MSTALNVKTPIFNWIDYIVIKTAYQYFSQAKPSNCPIIILLANLRIDVDFPKRAISIQRIAELEKQGAELTDRIAKLSKNCSKLVQAAVVGYCQTAAKKSNGSRNTGGQPGHPRHERPPLTTDEIDTFQTHTLDACPDWRGKLKEVESSDKVVQQVEIVLKPIHIEQHAAFCYRPEIESS